MTTAPLAWVPALVGTITLAAVLPLTGCGQRSGDDAAGAESKAITTTAKLDPAGVTVSASPASPEVSDPTVVTVDIIAERPVSLSALDYERLLGEGDRQFQFRVSRIEKPTERRLAEAGTHWTYRYELEFFLAGDFELPPVKVTFTESAPASGAQAARNDNDEPLFTGAASPKTFETDAIRLTVKSSAGGDLSPEELRTVRRLDPVDLPSPWERWSWVVAGTVATAAMLAWWLWSRLRRNRVELEPPLPADEWARRQLAALVADDLVARGMIQEFYYRVSAIVRGYIERRFRIAAPEMTTEEFLSAASDDPRLGFIGSAPLRDFVTSCDLVKYARHEPASGEADAVLRAAGDFVERTRARPDDEQPVAVMPSAAQERAA